MSNFSRDPILLTPGPLTTSLATKAAMLRDWGLVGRRVQRRHRRHEAQASRRHPRPRHARLRTDAGQRNVLGRGGSQHARPARRPRVGTRQRRLWHTVREAHEDDGAAPHDLRDRRGRADDAAGRRPAARGRSVDYARRADPLRDLDRHPEPAARDRGGRRPSPPEPHRRRDELVRGHRHRRADDACSTR